MSSLSVEYLIRVKMVKLPGDDIKYVIGWRFSGKAKPEKTGLIIKPEKKR